jgi:hypothetical protein
MNKAAQELGRLARGVPKNYSKEERLRRSEWMKEVTKRRVATQRKERDNQKTKTQTD